MKKSLINRKAKDRLRSNETRIALIALLLFAVLMVRLLCYTGPIFANTQDEGIYYTRIVSSVIYHNTYDFTAYRNANFSNLTSGIFNPAEAFQFYVGLMYPEIMLGQIFGYDVNLALYYIIFTSLVEALFIFLIIERIANRRAAAIGCILFAFFPLDVLFATQLEPQVPLAMACTIGIYLFIRGLDGKTARETYVALFLSGLFVGLGFITNPFGSATLVFLVIFLIIVSVKSIIEKGKMGTELRANMLAFVIVVVGFVVAYSFSGFLYQIEAGNFLLYPEVYHSITIYQFETQPLAYMNLTQNISIAMVTGGPGYYIPLLLDQPQYIYDSFLRYWGVLFYAVVLLAMFLAINRNKWLYFFGLMFLVYFVMMSALPTAIVTQNGITYIVLDSKQPYVMEALTLPAIVIAALGLELLLRSRDTGKTALAIIIILAVISADVLDLQSDTQYYNTSIATVKDMVGFASAHRNSTIYAEWLFAGEANIYSDYKYKIDPISCGDEKNITLNGSYMALGGMINFDTSPSIMLAFDDCTAYNFSTYEQVYNVSDPYANYSGGYAPPLEILNLSR